MPEGDNDDGVRVLESSKRDLPKEYGKAVIENPEKGASTPALSMACKKPQIGCVALG